MDRLDLVIIKGKEVKRRVKMKMAKEKRSFGSRMSEKKSPVFTWRGTPLEMQRNHCSSEKGGKRGEEGKYNQLLVAKTFASS